MIGGQNKKKKRKKALAYLVPRSADLECYALRARERERERERKKKDLLTTVFDTNASVNPNDPGAQPFASWLSVISVVK